MHDPSTVAFEIKSPFRDKPSKFWPKGYRKTLITIWHNDPEKDGTDDSCGWFIRPRHVDQGILKRIISRYEQDWDTVFKSSATDKVYHTGLFAPDGYPMFSTISVMTNLVFMAAFEHYGSTHRKDWSKARKLAVRFCRKHMFDIVHFAENVADSMRDSIQQSGFHDPVTREERIKRMAGTIYTWFLRLDRPWYQHPRWHIHHWSIQVHGLQQLRRFLLDRCAVCKRRFIWSNGGWVTHSWYGTRKKWWQGTSRDTCPRCANKQGMSTPAEPSDCAA